MSLNHHISSMLIQNSSHLRRLRSYPPDPTCLRVRPPIRSFVCKRRKTNGLSSDQFYPLTLPSPGHTQRDPISFCEQKKHSWRFTRPIQTQSKPFYETPNWLDNEPASLRFSWTRADPSLGGVPEAHARDLLSLFTALCLIYEQNSPDTLYP